jgi:hypothetical protein
MFSLDVIESSGVGRGQIWDLQLRLE